MDYGHIGALPADLNPESRLAATTRPEPPNLLHGECPADLPRDLEEPVYVFKVAQQIDVCIMRQRVG